MNLHTYLSSIDESAAAFAKRIGVAPAIVSQWKLGIRPVPISRCVFVEAATNGLVTRQDLRPDDWHLIWPEFVAKSISNGTDVQR